MKCHAWWNRISTTIQNSRYGPYNALALFFCVYLSSFSVGVSAVPDVSRGAQCWVAHLRYPVYINIPGNLTWCLAQFCPESQFKATVDCSVLISAGGNNFGTASSATLENLLALHTHLIVQQEWMNGLFTVSAWQVVVVYNGIATSLLSVNGVLLTGACREHNIAPKA